MFKETKPAWQACDDGWGSWRFCPKPLNWLKFAVFGILISLFERAYLLVYDDKMDKQTSRLWRSWEDYIREWLQRPDFREALPELLHGEDEDFTHYIEELAEQEKVRGAFATRQAA